MRSEVAPTPKVCPLLAAATAAAGRGGRATVEDPQLVCLGEACAWWSEAPPFGKCALATVADQIDRMG